MGTDEREKAAERWVRVWWGATVVSHYRAEAGIAEQYVDEVRPHFAGLRFTIDPLPSEFPPQRELPARQLWSLTP